MQTYEWTSMNHHRLWQHLMLKAMMMPRLQHVCLHNFFIAYSVSIIFTYIYLFILIFTFIDCLVPNETLSQPPKKKLTLSFEEYKNLSIMLVLYMRSEESRVESDRIFITILTIEISIIIYYIC